MASSLNRQLVEGRVGLPAPGGRQHNLAGTFDLPALEPLPEPGLGADLAAPIDTLK